MAYIMSAFIPIAAYPAKEAPHWRIGAKLYLGLACVAVVVFLGIWWALRWEERRKIAGSTENGTDSKLEGKVEDATAPNLRGVVLPAGL